MKQLVLFALAFFVLPLLPAHAEEDPSFVRLPLAEYNRLTEAARDPKKEPRPAPSEFALGRAEIRLQVKEQEDRMIASVNVRLTIEILENEWVAVPILPPGTPVRSASIAGKNAELFAAPDGLFWGVKKAGTYLMDLNYNLDALRSEAGMSLNVPVPRAAAITLDATLPGSELSPAVIPSAGTNINVSGNSTLISAAIPSSSGIQISWRSTDKKGHAISRASYRGNLEDEAVFWKGNLNVELFTNEPLTLPLLPQSATLSDVRLDGKSAPIMVDRGHFVTLVRGKGNHSLEMDFQVPVLRKNGPPEIRLNIPKIPVSRFDLRLPGKKEVKVSPQATVVNKEEGGETISTVYVPMTEQITFHWNEAVPEDIKTEVSANATLYHTVYAEEGVLYVQASVLYEVTRGKTNVIEFEVPKNVQLNRIISPSGEIADWRIVKGKDAEPDLVNVFLNQELEGTLKIDLQYDRSIVGDAAKENLSVPLLTAPKVQRQRGMVALLSSKELALKPIEENKLTRVGENQLPASLRQTIKKTVAHTYKYVEASPVLTVQATKPERKQGKFNALVNTLISLSDVTMKGAATIEVNVKSGSIMDLQLELPENVNFLSLTTASLRTHKVKSEEGKQLIDVQFTQEMEGQFRLELAYEQIMADTEAEAVVPTVKVLGAEVEQGRIAIEALSAVEVRASDTTKHLSSLEPNELPKQLVLKTTNPILLAFKYVHVDPPYRLALKITRHKEIDVQSATIDRASYQTLFTKDGMAVTAATFTVRNSRQQFLRVRLPEASKVWAAYVDGKTEKPALAENEKDSGKPGRPNVLIKIINSTQGFPVVLIYQTPVEPIARLGIIEAYLPRPDMVVTKTHWDVYLPDDVSYGKVDTNMTLKVEGSFVSKEAIEQKVRPTSRQGGIEQAQAPDVSIPTSGIHYAFEKLYANKADEDARFSLAYATGMGEVGAHVLVLLSTLLFWLGIGMMLIQRKSSAPSAGFVLGGAAALWLLIGYLGAPHIVAVLTSIVAIIVAGTFITRKVMDNES